MASTQKSAVSTLYVQKTENRFVLKDFPMYLQAINRKRLEPTNGTKPKPYLNNIPSVWKKFFGTIALIGKEEKLHQSTVSAMMKGTGVADEKRASTLLLSLQKVIEKMELDVKKPTITQTQVTVVRKEK